MGFWMHFEQFIRHTVQPSFLNCIETISSEKNFSKELSAHNIQSASSSRSEQMVIAWVWWWAFHGFVVAIIAISKQLSFHFSILYIYTVECLYLNKVLSLSFETWFLSCGLIDVSRSERKKKKKSCSWSSDTLYGRWVDPENFDFFESFW